MTATGPKCQCKGLCVRRISTRKHQKYGYALGGRRCRECGIFYTKEIMEKFGFSILCPCCGSKTTGRGCRNAAIIEKNKVIVRNGIRHGFSPRHCRRKSNEPISTTTVTTGTIPILTTITSETKLTNNKNKDLLVQVTKQVSKYNGGS